MKSRTTSSTPNRAASSGDCAKAQALNDKKAAPYLVDQKTGAKLMVPTMEKVGQLRQSSSPKSNQVCWMVFANESKIVKPGNLVEVVIGRFRADGLVVQ